MAFPSSTSAWHLFSVEGNALRLMKATLSSVNFEYQALFWATPSRTSGLEVENTHIMNGIIFNQSEETLTKKDGALIGPHFWASINHSRVRYDT